MSVTAVNHFTILTDKLPETLAFYDQHLNLKPGARPPFTFPGAWLYADGGRGKDPILHIIAGVDSKRLVKGVIDHMAFFGTGLAQTVARLKAKGIDFDQVRVSYRKSDRPEIEDLTKQRWVPVLVHGDEVIHDSKRIVEYLRRI